MSQNVGIKQAALAALLLLAIALLAACASSVAQSDYDAVKQQLSSQEQKVGDLQKQLSDREAAARQAPRPIVGAIPNAPPRPAPTPAPPGFVAPPPPQAPAPEVKALFLDVNTVTAGPGESRYNVDADKYCASSSIFKRGMHLVWLMKAYDASTGKELQTGDVKEAVVKLPHGENVNLRYGRHGSTADAPWHWAAAWDIPLDYPLGILDYEVTITSATDKRASFKPWGGTKVSFPDRTPPIENRLTIIE